MSEEEIIKRVENYISEHKWNVQGGYETNTIQALLNLYKNIKDKIKIKIEYLDEEGFWEFTTDRDSDKAKEILQELLEGE